MGEPMNNKTIVLCAAAMILPIHANAKEGHSGGHGPVSDDVIAQQRAMLSKTTAGKGYGPQSPRDIDSATGENARAFNAAPARTQTNLCNIHFHKNAEHKGGEFASYAGNGNGHGYESGFKYSGTLSASELSSPRWKICGGKHGSLHSGDTIEVHYVHSTAQVAPGPTLGACLSDAIGNPQLRVETQVYVVVNDTAAMDFGHLTKHGMSDGYHQALNIPTNTGTPTQYAGSTTGPGYNEKGSPFQVSWSVRPKVAKVSIESVGKWCEGNTFNEDHGHGVRNLVVNPDLLSKIEK
jgi:hypothetical protein